MGGKETWYLFKLHASQKGQVSSLRQRPQEGLLGEVQALREESRAGGAKKQHEDRIFPPNKRSGKVPLGRKRSASEGMSQEGHQRDRRPKQDPIAVKRVIHSWPKWNHHG